MEKQNYRNPHPYLSQFCYDSPHNSTENIPLQQNTRNKPMPGLYEQFEKLKQKIQSVEVRNEQIIERIRNFRKNNVYSEEDSRAGELQHPHTADQLDSQYSQLSQSGNYFGFQSPCSNRGLPISNYNFSQTASGKNFHHYSLPMEEPENLIVKPTKQQKKSKSRSKAKSPTSIISKKKKKTEIYAQQDELRSSHMQSLLNLQKNKVYEMKKEIQRLEDINSQLKHIENKYRFFVQNTKSIIQNNLINFFEGVIKANLNQIDRNFKKNQFRLLNLSVQIRQAREDHKSNKILRDHRLKRSTSRSKALTPTPRNHLSKPDLSKSITKTQDPAVKKNKQFQQIANKYQEIIRTKNQEIESFDAKYKQKQMEIEKLKLKIEQLNKEMITDGTLKQQSQKSSKKYEKQIKELRQIECNLQQKIKQLQQQKKDLLSVSLKLDKLQTEIDEKDNIINSLKQVNAAYECKIISLQHSQRSTSQTNINMERIVAELQAKTKALTTAEQSYALLQKKYMEIECQLYGVTNRLKKSEQAVQMKQKKIEELEKLLQQNQELHEKSLFVQSLNNYSSKINPIKAEQVANIVKELQRVEEQLQNKKSQNLILNKQKDIALLKITDLEEKITVLKKSNDMLEEQNQILHKRIEEEKMCTEQSVSDEEDRKKAQQDLFEAIQKCNSLTKTIQNLRNENLETNSKLMKSQSQLEFVKDSLTEKEQILDKIKSDNQLLRQQKLALQKKLNQLQYEVQIERKENQDRIRQLEEQWAEFQEKMYEGKADFGQDLISQRSMNMNMPNDIAHLTTQNELLNEKLKEKEAIIQILNSMQKKMVDQYRINVEKVKTDIREKNNTIEKLNNELSRAKKRISVLEKKQIKTEGANNRENQLEEQIQDLEKQLKDNKDLYDKATEMYGELIQQLRAKENQKAQLLRQIQFKNLRIHEFQEILQVKEAHNISKVSMKSKLLPKESFIFNARASQNIGENLQNLLHEGSMLKHEGTIDFQLSMAEQSFLENSHLNVSQLFKDFPHEKLKLKKKQHRLFQKTSSYIKSLKDNIEQKNKKIRTLQKKIKSLKSSELVRKQYEFSGKELFVKEKDLQGQFKDYESENLQFCKGRSHRKMKALENDTKLIIEENNMLVQQIQHFQDELQRAEEQQNSLMKIKDLYKDEIKKLMKKLDDQAKAFDDQLQKERRKIQQSQSVHNYQQLKQIFVKLCTVLNKPVKKKQEKKKELVQHAKHICTILNMDQGQRNTITDLFSKTD